MSSSANNAFLFLINVLFNLYAYTLILRVMLQLVRADFYNPLAQFIWRVTNPPTQLLRKVVPRYRQVDIPAVVILILVALINILVVLSIVGVGAGVLTLIKLTILKCVVLVINLLTFTLLIQAVMSWFGASMHSPASSLLWNINEPMLRPVRRAIPPIGGLDLSPLVVIILLQFASRLVPLSPLLR